MLDHASPVREAERGCMCVASASQVIGKQIWLLQPRGSVIALGEVRDAYFHQCFQQSRAIAEVALPPSTLASFCQSGVERRAPCCSSMGSKVVLDDGTI